MRAHRLVTLAACLLFSLQAFSAGEAQHLLDTHFQNKVLFIRGFYSDSKLAYDAQGNVKGTPSVGPWSLALFRVDFCYARQGEFVLGGKRAAEVYDRDKNKFVTTLPPKTEDLQITVEAPSDTISDATLDALADRMFESRITSDEVPEWWRPFFSRQQKALKDYAGGNPIPGLELHGEPVFRAAQGRVTPPKLLAHSEPKYQEIARQAKYQGITVLNLIVSKEGVPQRLEVVKPLGMGLDDNAVETVRNWRFSPAMLNGQPVPVLISVEVNFRLF